MTPIERAVLWELMCRPIVGNGELIEALWPNPDVEPDWAYSEMKTYIHRLRRKLAGSGWRIVTFWGRGYGLERAC